MMTFISRANPNCQYCLGHGSRHDGYYSYPCSCTNGMSPFRPIEPVEYEKTWPGRWIDKENVCNRCLKDLKGADNVLKIVGHKYCSAECIIADTEIEFLDDDEEEV